MSSFDAIVCAPVRAHLGRPVRLPSLGTWDVSTARGAPLLSLELPHAVLAENLQTNGPATPFFLLCFAWWHAHITRTDPFLRVSIVGDPPTDAAAVRHLRRSRIALEALTAALGDRIVVEGLSGDPWPAAPVFNAPNQVRGSDLGGKGPEHMVEVQLTDERNHAESVPAGDLTIDRFRRQLPLGLFDGEVARSAHWTPGQGAQADLWATSPDGSVFHLFELKVKGNETVGILPELLTYLWLIHRARAGLPDGRTFRGGAEGLEAARRAERLVGWTLAPHLHPLLGSASATPMRWLADGLRDRIDLGMLFYRDVGGSRPFGGWDTERTWRGWVR
jgi:hypothetical protein